MAFSGNCKGVIVARPEHDDGVIAWCPEVGRIKVASSAGVDKMKLCEWFNFTIKQVDSAAPKWLDVAAAHKPKWLAVAATPIAPVVPTKFFKTVNSTMVTVVTTGLIGAVHSKSAIGYAESFGRVIIDPLGMVTAMSSVDRIKAGGVYSMTLVKLKPKNDCEWAVRRIERQIADQSFAPDRQIIDAVSSIGVRQVIGHFDHFDGRAELCWLRCDDDPPVCFGQCDYVTEDDVTFNPGDRFIAWIGQRRPIDSHVRAFYVERLTDQSSLPSPIPSVPSMPTTSAVVSSVKDASSQLDDLSLKTLMIDKESQTDAEAKAEVPNSNDALAAKGRSIIDRIMKNRTLYDAVCATDSSILHDLYTVFNP